ncbi:type VI secretion system tip protein TssI/VgrG [Roseateles asaccharophilus]|uniref:Type VI secretion system secreted protein VgrG n=1 Tax=Roseateles asaccharophilus TaxID=582607 RepID=A0ABU2A9G0_9BURK|nr:type VI secretion system tip protein TssI/VgrG [Roseateles asaccharophilus]MDR7333840.1 type VI secretion system secreted protein VgrG [Roseateles asaccharophilus]
MSDAVMSITTTLGGDKLLVLRMDGKEQLGQLPEWNVDLVGNVSMLGVRETINLHKLLGTRANVSIAHGAKRNFNGYITEAQRGERHGRFESFRITMRPWLWFATKTRNSKVFQNKSVKDIVKAVLTPYSPDFEWRVKDTGVDKALEYCVQYNESDFDFVSRLLEEFGVYYFFEHTSTTHTLVLIDALDKHEAKTGTKTIQWSHKLEAGKPGIVDWSLIEEVHSIKAVVRDYDYLATATAIEQTQSASMMAATEKRGPAEVYEYPARAVLNQVKDASQPATTMMNRFAKLRLEELQSLQKVFTGTTNANDLEVGTYFELEDALTPADDDTYVVVSMNFSAEFADHEAIDDLKAVHQRRDGVLASFMCIPKDGNAFRPQRRTPRPIMYGPQTAVVVGKSGTEVDCDKHGRIRVQFHWDRLGKKDENSSCYLRLSQPWAGKNMGLWMIPRVGHEVVVSFLGGDPDRPLITGSVHNDVNVPPYPLPDNSDISGWRTHSTKDGKADARHELRFDDKTDGEYIWLQSQKDFHRHVKADAFDWIEMNETKKVKLTRQEVVGENWYVNVGKDVMHDLGKDLHTKVAGDIFTTGAATYQLKLDKDYNAKVGADYGLDVTGKTAVKSGGDINLQSGGAANIKTTGNLVGEAGAKLSLKATADLLMQGVNVKAKGSAEIVLEATAGIKIVCGASVITLGPAGVTIDGPLVKVNCGGGGGSAGAAESAAAAEPKAPEDAKNQELLTPAKVKDYDKLFEDPLKEATGTSTPAAGGAGATAGAGAGGMSAGALPGAGAVSALRAGALAAGAAALAAGGAVAVGFAAAAAPAPAAPDDSPAPVTDETADAIASAEAAYAAEKEEERLAKEEADKAAEQASKDAAASQAALKDAEAAANAELSKQTAEQAQAEAEAAYATAKTAEAAAQQPGKTADEVVAASDAAYAEAKAAEAAAQEPGKSADEVVAESEAAYAAAKAAEAQAAADAAAAADPAAPPPPAPAPDDGGGAA